MSVMKCYTCDRCIDTDYNVEGIEVWSPECMCDKCFEGLEPAEAWNLALKTLKHEMRYGDLESKIKELLK